MLCQLLLSDSSLSLLLILGLRFLSTSLGHFFGPLPVNLYLFLKFESLCFLVLDCLGKHCSLLGLVSLETLLSLLISSLFGGSLSAMGLESLLDRVDSLDMLQIILFVLSLKSLDLGLVPSFRGSFCGSLSSFLSRLRFIFGSLPGSSFFGIGFRLGSSCSFLSLLLFLEHFLLGSLECSLSGLSSKFGLFLGHLLFSFSLSCSNLRSFLVSLGLELSKILVNPGLVHRHVGITIAVL